MHASHETIYTAIYAAPTDLSESVNLEHGSIWGHYDPETNPSAPD